MENLFSQLLLIYCYMVLYVIICYIRNFFTRTPQRFWEREKSKIFNIKKSDYLCWFWSWVSLLVSPVKPHSHSDPSNIYYIYIFRLHTKTRSLSCMEVGWCVPTNYPVIHNSSWGWVEAELFCDQNQKHICSASLYLNLLKIKTVSRNKDRRT